MNSVKLIYKRILPLLCVLICLVSFGACGAFETINYEPCDEAVSNPYMGLMVYANGNPDTVVQDISMVYVETTWAELEPERGKIDYETLEERCQFELWRSKGYHAVFRLVLDDPDDEMHMDIPQWLYDMTGDGVFYDIDYGKGYCPDYNNQTLIDEHARLISLIGEHYADDDFIAFIELGSVGHWGEWHIHPDAGVMPAMSVCAKYYEPYKTAFPDKYCMFRRPFAFTGDDNVGLYNDMVCDTDSTEEWLKWIAQGGEYNDTGEQNALQPMPDAWKTAPIGGEVTSKYPDLTVHLKENLEQTISLLSRSHAAWIGPHGFARVDDSSDSALHEGMQTLLKTVGYRIYVSKLEIRGSKINVSFANDGISPFYYDWQTSFHVTYKDGSDEYIVPDDFSIRDVLPGEAVKCSFRVKGDIESISVAILNPAKYEYITLSMDTPRDKAYTVLYTNEE